MYHLENNGKREKSVLIQYKCKIFILGNICFMVKFYLWM